MAAGKEEKGEDGGREKLKQVGDGLLVRDTGKLEVGES